MPRMTETTVTGASIGKGSSEQMAFPLAHDWGSQEGMTLRDYFAGQAMPGILLDERLNCREIAERSYQMADAMMKARAQK